MSTPPESAKPMMPVAFQVALAIALGVVGVAAWIGLVFLPAQQRFEEVETRVESMMPEARGLAATPFDTNDAARIVIRILPRGSGSGPERAYTLRLDEDAARYTLPRGWAGHDAESVARRATFDAVFARLRVAVREKVTRFGVSSGAVRGEVVAATTDGSAVPPGIVTRALNAFLEAGLSDVVFDDGMQGPTSETRGGK